MMYAEDLNIWEQSFIVALVTFVLVGVFYMGMWIKEHDLAEEQKRRDAENAAHRAATDGAKRDRFETWA